MAISRRLLIEGEEIVYSMRTHLKALFVPFLLLLLAAAVGGFLASWFNSRELPVVMWVIIAIAVLVAIMGFFVPLLNWLLWTFTITDKRLIEQKGILTRTGRVIPLNRINDVSFEKHLSDRILRCGTLIVHDASEQIGLRIHDVPHVEDVHRTLTDLIFQQGRDERPAVESV